MEPGVTYQIRNRDWSPQAVIDHFSGSSSGGDLYDVLRAFGERDNFLNAGYSRRRHRHWGGKAQIRLVDRLARRLTRLNRNGVDLLDAGCGRGGPAFRALEQWNLNVTGLDLCPYNIERARTRTRTLRIHEGLTFTVASGQRMPYPSNTFDLAWSIESAAYMDDKVAFFREIKRVLKPGGAFAMAAISINPEAVVASPALLETYVAYLRAWDMPFLEPVDRYESIMEESGLAVKRIEDATRWTLDPHAKRLRRLLRCWDWRVLFWLSRWYVGRKSEADLASIRSQLSATHDAIAAGLISYGLYWAVSEEQSD